MYLAICLLLLIILIICYSSVREQFCPCGIDLTKTNSENIETFCNSGCVETFNNYCPDKCSSKRYPLEYLYCQTCRNNVPQTSNTSMPYYLLPP